MLNNENRSLRTDDGLSTFLETLMGLDILSRSAEPKASLSPNDGALEVKFLAPGVEPSQIDVSVDDSKRSFSVSIPTEIPENSDWCVSEEFDIYCTSAACKNGVLTVTIPKVRPSKPTKPRKITVWNASAF